MAGCFDGEISGVRQAKAGAVFSEVRGGAVYTLRLIVSRDCCCC
jgi:hypothetical protein